MNKIILFNLLYFSIILYIYYTTIPSNIIFKCNSTILYTNASYVLTSRVKLLYLSIKSKSKYIYFLSDNGTIKQSLQNIDYENYSLLYIKDAFVTNRVIIHKCKIILFHGQCQYTRWYINSIKKNELLISISYGFIITNWHGDGVFHGTVEGLTRIVPYIDFLLTKTNTYILIPFPRYKQNTASKILQLIGFSNKRILYGKYHVRKLLIPTPYYCVESSTPLIIKFNEILRSKMKSKYCKDSNTKYILILQRSKNRIFKDFDILKSELLNNFNYTIITYYDRNKNLDEIYCWFTYAKIIIAYHGSGLTNIYFSKESTVVVELSPTSPIYAFAKLGSQLGLRYYIYKTPVKKLYTRLINFNITTFIFTLKSSRIFDIT